MQSIGILEAMILRILCLIAVLVICLRAEAKTLDETNTAKFKAAFNQASGNVRLVALLSPT